MEREGRESSANKEATIGGSEQETVTTSPTSMRVMAVDSVTWLAYAMLVAVLIAQIVFLAVFDIF